MNQTEKIVWWMNELGFVIGRLPDPDSLQWTDSQRALWIEAFAAMLDLMIETVPDQEE